MLPQVVLPLLGADLRDGAAVGSGAGGGVAAKEALVTGGSSASFSKAQQELSEAEGRWEEYRSLASGGAAQVTATTAARVTSATFRTARATGAAGEVAGARAGAAGNEEFLRSYLAEVSAGAVRGIIFSDLSGTVFLRRGCLQADRKERRDRISSVCGGDR